MSAKSQSVAAGERFSECALKSVFQLLQSPPDNREVERGWKESKKRWKLNPTMQQQPAEMCETERHHHHDRLFLHSSLCSPPPPRRRRFALNECLGGWQKLFLSDRYLVSEFSALEYYYDRDR